MVYWKPCRRADGKGNRVVFSRSFRGLLVVGLFVVLTLCTTVLGASAQENNGVSNGFVALSGDGANQYQVPGDVREVWRSADNGVTQTRYQQYVGDAAVYGGQITTLSRNGQQAAVVVGNHYSNLTPSNEVKLSKAGAPFYIPAPRQANLVFPYSLLPTPREFIAGL